MSRDKGVVICILNGFGDSVLAYPFIQHLLRMHGSEDTWLITQDYMIQTVFSSLDCRFLPVNFRPQLSFPFVDERFDIEKIVKSLSQVKPLKWISLNAYSPLWPFEEQLLIQLIPAEIASFKDLYTQYAATFSNAPQEHIRTKLGRVVGFSESLLEELPRRLPVQTTARIRIKQWCDSVSIGECPLVIAHIDTIQEKSWTTGKWQSLAEILQNVFNARLVAVGNPPDWIQNHSAFLPWPYGQDFTLYPEDWHAQCALFEIADCFIGIDAGWAHVADAMNCPGVVLIRKELLTEWRPTGERLKPITLDGAHIEECSVGMVMDVVSEVCQSVAFAKKSRWCYQDHANPSNGYCNRAARKQDRPSIFGDFWNE